MAEVVVLSEIHLVDYMCCVKKATNLKIFNRIKRISESKHFQSTFNANVAVNLMIQNYSKQKLNNHKCQCLYKNPIKDHMCEEDCAYNPSICACECVKGYKIGE